MEVNDRTYRWSEDRRKECEMCDRGVDETGVFNVRMQEV